MTEQERSLAEILEELHEALENAPEIGREGREALRRAATEIREALDQPEGARDASLGEQLTSALERFEVAHPELTQIVGRISRALSDLGI